MSEAPNVTPRAAASRTRKLVRSAVGLAVTAVCLWLVFRQVDLAEFEQALAQFHWPYLPLGVLSLAGGYSMRIVRWAIIIRAGGDPVRNLSCAAPFLGGMALNNVLPFRSGDVVRALVFPAAIGIRRVTATASLVQERLVDLLTLLFCLAVGFALSTVTAVPDWVRESAVGLTLAGGGVLMFIVVFGGVSQRMALALEHRLVGAGGAWAARLVKVGRELLLSISAMSRTRVLVVLFLVSLLVWAGEAGLYWALLVGLDIPAGPTAALLTMALGTLSTLLPASPGYVGTFHLTAFTSVTMLGGSASQAASFAVLVHLGFWVPVTVAGGLAILANPRLFQIVDLPPSSRSAT